MTTHIPKPGERKILGVINNHLTWLAIKPEAQVFVFGCHQHLEIYHFEKGARISFWSGENGQELHVEPEKAFTKRTGSCLMPYPLEEDNRMIALLHLLVNKRVITKQEATDLFRNGNRPITVKMSKETKYIWDGM